jgi:hypothetical protein
MVQKLCIRHFIGEFPKFYCRDGLSSFVNLHSMGDAVFNIALDRCSCILSPEVLSEARYVYSTLRVHLSLVSRTHN